MFTRTCSVIVASVLAVLSGCGPPRLDSPISATLDVSSNEKSFEVPAVKSERTVVVEASSSNSEIDIYVVEASKADKFAGDNYEGRAKNALAAKQKVKSDTLEAKVPADTEAQVIIMLCDKGDRKKSEVTGKITSKK